VVFAFRLDVLDSAGAAARKSQANRILGNAQRRNNGAAAAGEEADGSRLP
jgi:hypothetical protein